MARRKPMAAREAFPHSVNITQSDTYDFNGIVIERGKELRIKNLRGIFLFYCYGQNSDLGVEWVTVMSKDAGSFHSYRPDQIKDVVKPKVPRKRRIKSVG